MANFDLFQKTYFETFAPAGMEAENAFAVGMGLCALSCRRALELAVKFVYSVENLEKPYSDDLSALLSNNEFKKLLPGGFLPRIDYIRRIGNLAAHTGRDVNRQEAVVALSNLFEFVDWIDYSYSAEYEQKSFSEEALPKPLTQAHDAIARSALERNAIERERKLVEASLAQKTQTLEQFQQENAALQEELQRIKREREQTPYVAADISEYETRRQYIDLDLKEAGWKFGDNCITEVLVTGMPFGSGEGFVDYVLYGKNGKPLAVVEAKRTSKDARVGQQQALLYADCLARMTGQRPVIFYTNGFETWLWDDTLYPPRRVFGMYSPDDLAWLMDKRRERLQLAHLDINDGITNRYYQKEAIRAVCDSFGKMQRHALLVMATGTGKTRTVISLVDILSRYGWVKNVLFLADRTALVRQAKKNFKAHLPHMSLCNLVERGKDETPDARVVFSTYQTIMGAIDGERTEDGRLFTVGHFDLVIVDEAHRSIYNKFSAIFDYFDGLLVGLTATPRGEVDRDTYRIFELETGVPTYAYELDQAIADKFLVRYTTAETTLKFIDQGIAYDELSEDERREYEEKFGNPETPENLPPWIEASALNTWLFNQDTVDKVLIDLMSKGIRVEGGDKLGKTIIFARKQKHADFIVERFGKLFPELGGNFARVVYSGVNYIQSTIDDFSTSGNMPQIAVSVDMLDTGIDIPEIVNLVFFKKVLSKIKFEQMVGRGTRLCENLFAPDTHKTHFLCFDYCGNFEFFRKKKEGEKGSTMPSLTERSFRLRVDIAVELQGLKWQKGDYPACRAVFVQSLAGDVNALNRDSFFVRQRIGFVDRYRNEAAWQALTQVQSAEVKNELASIIAPVAEDETARRFDILMYRLEWRGLLSLSISSEQKDLLAIAEALSKLGTLIQVRLQSAIIAKVLNASFWSSPTLRELEEVRMALRALVQFLKGDGKAKSIYTNFSDVVMDVTEGEYEPRATEYANYRRKVETYIRNNKDHLVIHKLRTNKPLSQDDFKELERILWNEVGTHEDYVHEFGEKPMSILVREISGLDQQAANEAFSAFMDDHDLTHEQIVYIKMIVDFVVRNGILQLKQLQDEPFRTVGSIVELFPTEKVSKIAEIVRGINRNAGLA